MMGSVALLFALIGACYAQDTYVTFEPGSRLGEVMWHTQLAFIKAEKVCNFTGQADVDIPTLRKAYCNGTDVKPEYKQIATCFMMGIETFSANYIYLEESTKCSEIVDGYAELLFDAASRCPNRPQAFKTGLRGTVAWVDSVLAVSDDILHRACYVELGPALWSGLPLMYMWLTMQTMLEKFDTPMYRMLLNSGIGLDAVFTAWINAALVNKYRNIILCQGSPTQDAEVELPLEDVVARQVPVPKANVSSASIVTASSGERNEEKSLFTPDFFFLHADEICGWSDTLGNYVISLKKEFCIGRSAKPEYTNITQCFKEGGKPLNERYTELATNASCSDTEILYRDYINTAARSCPESAKTAKVAARGVMIELLVRMVLAANGAEGQCYVELAFSVPNYFNVEVDPQDGTSTPIWPVPQEDPTAPDSPEPYPVPCGSGH
ncbi:unnamed protein product, partial [Mesorhabditis spiculigera]